jgi:hypothetical protein
MNINMSSNNSVVLIGGKKYEGKNIQINGDQVIIDGKTQEDSLVGNINVVVHGNIESLEHNSGNITAENIETLNTISGDVECGNVSGNIKTVSGDVECGNVSGNVKTVSGDIEHS